MRRMNDTTGEAAQRGRGIVRGRNASFPKLSFGLSVRVLFVLSAWPSLSVSFHRPVRFRTRETPQAVLRIFTSPNPSAVDRYRDGDYAVSAASTAVPPSQHGMFCYITETFIKAGSTEEVNIR